ncbi:MAG: hypothetical protein LBH09_02980 [Peptococcaceae bacterium]|jgi:hypothetical protein|nr:hypothetical protein [Peptococcaceae bacterium]
MRVRLRFLCADLPIPPGIHEIDMDDGGTVEQALTAYRQINPAGDPNDTLRESMFLIGRQSAQLDTVLQDMDTLMVMRILGGG